MLLGSAAGAGLLLLLAVLILHNRPRIDHYRIDRGPPAAAGRSIQMLVKRTPDQQRDQNDVQRD